METKITMLPVAMLHPHRDNPRKELGDLTELEVRTSFKEVGKI